MKSLLALSKREPVQAAIGLTADGEGLMFLHQTMKPKKVLASLRAEASKEKIQLNNATLRFGRAVVDTDYDAGMVRFFINKDAPGTMRVKLVEVVKRIAYQKVEINVDPSLEEEPEEGESSDAAVGLDPAVLKQDLRSLVGRIGAAAGDDATRKAQLVSLASQANDGLKADTLDGAAALIAELRKAIDAPVPQAGSALIWNNAKDIVDQQLNRLYAALRESGLAALEAAAEAIESKLQPYRVGLITALMEYDQSSGEGREPARAKARKMVAEYKTRIVADPFVIGADENPLDVVVTIREVLGDALEQLEHRLTPP